MNTKRAFGIGCAVMIMILISMIAAESQPITRAQDISTGVTATTQDGLNMRALPTTDAAIVGMLPPETTVEIRRRALNLNGEQWFFTTYDGRDGWIASWLVTTHGNLEKLPWAGPEADTTCTDFDWPGTFNRRDDFMVGVNPNDFLAKREWDRFWHQVDPLTVIRENGVDWMRVGILTRSDQRLRETPYERWAGLSWSDGYWSSLEYGERILQEAARLGYRLDVFLYLSNHAAHASFQDAPPEWQSLSIEEKTQALEQYTYDTLSYFKVRGLNIEVVEVGNEIEGGILNYRLGERFPSPPSGVNPNENMDYMAPVWETEAIWLQAAITGVRRANPNAKIVLHATMLTRYAVDDSLMVRSFFRAMVEAGVDFDYIGLSHPYPYSTWLPGELSSRCWFDYMNSLVNDLASLGKKVMICEAAYQNRPRQPGAPISDYPYTPMGQAAWLRDQLIWSSNNPNMVGFFYWYPDYFHSMAPSLSEGDIGLFQNDTMSMPGMREFRVNLPGPYATLDSRVRLTPLPTLLLTPLYTSTPFPTRAPLMPTNTPTATATVRPDFTPSATPTAYPVGEIPLCQAVFGCQSAFGQVEANTPMIWTFRGEAGQPISVRVRGAGLTLEIYGSDGALLLTIANGAQDMVLPASGLYTLVGYPVRTALYTLTLLDLSD